MSARTLIRAACAAAMLVCAACACAAPTRLVDLSVSAPESLYGMVTRGAVGAPDASAPVTLKVTARSIDGRAHSAEMMAVSSDGFGVGESWTRRFTLEVPADGETTSEVEFDGGLGFHHIRVSAKCDGTTQAADLDLGVIPPQWPGMRKDSFFASNTSSLRRGDELRFLQMIGMKVERAHFQPWVSLQDAGWAEKPSTGAALPLDFADQDAAMAETKAHDMWVLPIVGYSLQNPGGMARSALAKDLQMYGPPRNSDEFVNTWESILRRYPDITTYEFWNEPWIYGWTWAATPSEYRTLQKSWCDMALRVNPDLRILAGNSSMFATDVIAPDPASWKGLISGVTHHPYLGCEERSFRSGAQGRTIDDGMQTAARMGVPYYYLTEGGTLCAPKNGLDNAAKIVQYFTRAALVGCFQGNAQWDIGYGPGWTRSNTAFSVMTHMLEDRPIAADIWPQNELIWGAVFANPRWVTPEVKALPRAGELAARWDVATPEGRASDRTKVAVVWGLTGMLPDRLDLTGAISMPATGVRAFEMFGREILPEGGTLTVPLNWRPVYIVSDDLSVVELRDRIGRGTIAGVCPVNMYAESLRRPFETPQSLVVRVENQLNRLARGTLELRIGNGPVVSRSRISIAAGSLADVSIRWPGMKSYDDRRNMCLVKLTARIDGCGRAGVVEWRQPLSVARFAKRSITVDGKLDDWAGVAPVFLGSDWVRHGADTARYLLNPNLKRPSDPKTGQWVAAQTYTAYDNRNVYIAAVVSEDELRCTAGTPVVMGENKVALPYANGVPNGLNHIVNCGDVFSFAFGFRERTPGWGRQVGDPYLWKGMFYDTDYQYAAHTSVSGGDLLRLWGPNTGRRNAFQTENTPGVGPVDGAQVRVTRDEETRQSIYEIAIPRGELKLFDPKKGVCRFTFMVHNDEGLPPVSWSSFAGGFDYWQSCGTFSPTWTSTAPCQAFFGIDR